MVGKSDFRKVKVILPFIFFLFSLFFFSFVAQAQWEGAVVQRLTFDTLPDQSPHLFIDENDKLHLFYQHHQMNGLVPWDYWLLYRTKEKGKPWSEPDTIKHFSRGDDYRLAYDWHYDIIHLAYHPGYSTDSTGLYYTNSSMNWQPILAESTGKGYTGLDMKIDSLGNVHLVYFNPIDTTGRIKVLYATNITGSWVWQEVSPLIDSGYGGTGPALLSLKKNGIAHILYTLTHPRPYFWVPRLLCHAYNDIPGGTVWHTDTLDGPTYGDYTHFIVDGDGHMHMLTVRVVGFDFDSFYVYYSCRPSITEPWSELETVAQPMGEPNCMYIDRQKNVHITWNQRDHMLILGTVFYATKKSGSWESIKILENEPYWSEGFNFVIDSEGKGHGVFKGYSGSPVDQATSEIYYLGEDITWVDTTPSEKELKFQLSQNYPNPFNSFTTIPFAVHGKQKTENSPIPTTLKIYNILGEEVRTLIDEKKKEGEYKVVWDGKDDKGKEVSSGIYFYVLKCGQYKQTKKMILIK
jgi:hypothetical protein